MFFARENTKLKNENSHLYVSYDGGHTWEDVGSLSYEDTVTYEQLSDLVSKGKLVPGRHYHITDYTPELQPSKTLPSKDWTILQDSHSVITVRATTNNTLAADATYILEDRQYSCMYNMSPSLVDYENWGDGLEHTNNVLYDFAREHERILTIQADNQENGEIEVVRYM